MNRRTFIKRLGLIPLIPFLPACQFDKMITPPIENEFLARAGPINHTLIDQAPLTFTGDDFTRPHQILWNKPAFIEAIGGRPKPKRTEELVIIGGGMSGLMSAYLLREKKPVILEQAGRFGGNAKGESWNGLHYSIGAAYLIKPAEDSGLFKMFKDLGIINDWSIKSGGGGQFVLNGQLIENFWNGASEPNHKARYKHL